MAEIIPVAGNRTITAIERDGWPSLDKLGMTRPLSYPAVAGFLPLGRANLSRRVSRAILSRMSVTAPDFTKAPPRPGRHMLGAYAWLARIADKVRADRAGTGADYIAYCGISRAFLERCGIAQDDFDALIARGADDEELVAYFDRCVPPERREAANNFILVEKAESLDKQDAEEGYA